LYLDSSARADEARTRPANAKMSFFTRPPNGSYRRAAFYSERTEVRKQEAGSRGREAGGGRFRNGPRLPFV
jgi:hypothetical protein